MTAACNSRRGIVSSFRGATLDFAAANRTPHLPSVSFHWTYAHAPNACLEVSLKTIKEGSPQALGGVRQRLNLTLFKAIISSNNFIQLRFISGGTSSSQLSLDRIHLLRKVPLSKEGYL